ncbi:MAG: hypothetical protein HYU86_01925 [Chloroflexi bacterium]|nr:hypothetical protein [Chloroflexota bacterium]
MKRTKLTKLGLALIVVGVAALLVVGASTYLGLAAPAPAGPPTPVPPFGPPVPFPTPAPKPRLVSPVIEPDPTVEWREFVHPDLKYSIKYPGKWYLIPGSIVFITSYDMRTVKNPSMPLPKTEIKIDIMVATRPLPAGQSLREWLYSQITDKSIILEEVALSLGGAEALKVVIEDRDPGARPATVVYVAQRPKVIKIVSSAESVYANIFDQIVASFRFTQ